MTELQKKFDLFIQEFLDSDVVKRYQAAKEVLREYPDKFARTQELRAKNYALQNNKEKIDLYDETDRLMKEYRDVYKDPITKEYLQAEVAICKIIQQANLQIIQCLDFDDVLIDE